jgi:hypothetical protein
MLGTAVIVAVVVVCVLSAAPAGATGPGNGCPPGFEQIVVLHSPVDRNGDHLICGKAVQGTTVLIDNHFPR